jgi:phosphatidylglycerophosphatase A
MPGMPDDAATPRAPFSSPLTWIASGLGAGLSPIAPGTAGSAVGLILFLPLIPLPLVWQIVATVAVTLLGVWASTVTARRLAAKDPGFVVVDEVAGMWITLLAVPLSWGAALAGFFLFRAMDVVKPFPARQFESFPGGWGIMADDVMAGIYANLVLQVLVRGLGWL